MTSFVDYPVIGRTYQHYKGGLYSVLTLAKNTETQEDMVVYQSLLFGSYYTRPLKMWNSCPDNQPLIKRFVLIKDDK